jgi:orotidine-5'-phosphate decarboxylase
MDELLIALDVDSGKQALELADRLRGVAGGFKIGSRLFTSEGPAVVKALVERGDRVFLDLKFHDIPNTVAGAVAAAAGMGVWMLNVHASGGLDMMRAAAGAAEESAARNGVPRPLVVAVTILTSLDAGALAAIGFGGPAAVHVESLARLARQAGLDGVVASPLEIGAIRTACGDDFQIVTPGIRPSTGGRTDDQARTLSAAGALDAGANFIVVGRPIIAAPDPLEAAGRMAAEAGRGHTNTQ